MPRSFLWLVFATTSAGIAIGEETRRFSNERMAEFLRSASVVEARPVGTGVTGSWRLTLRDSELTHDASFQSVDERAPVKDLGGGRVELHFVDSYRFNIAAFRLAELVGLDDMVPVSVERHWRGERGAFTWWVDDVRMDENEMRERGLASPDVSGWNEQIYRVRVFSELVYDTDRNRSNLLVTADWRVWMIDFSRAFRRWTRLRSGEGLHRCDRELLASLKALTRDRLRSRLEELLTEPEVEGLLARRDLLVEHYEALISERGESAVLY